MLDGAEDILREDGYGALTSRSVAERIGVKQRLVYYYFQTMEELIVETFRRLSVRELERLRQALAADRPLREIWDVCVHTSDARLISEFMALANRIDPLRAEVIHFIEESRRIQVEGLLAALRARDLPATLPPIVVVMMATSLALTLTRESALGVSDGHGDVMTVIGAYLDALEPSST